MTAITDTDPPYASLGAIPMPMSHLICKGSYKQELCVLARKAPGTHMTNFRRTTRQRESRYAIIYCCEKELSDGDDFTSWTDENSSITLYLIFG